MVLILILLEMRLLEKEGGTQRAIFGGLNPYSTGNEVVGRAFLKKRQPSHRLNPYSTGNEVVGWQENPDDKEQV